MLPIFQIRIRRACSDNSLLVPGGNCWQQDHTKPLADLDCHVSRL